MWAHIPLSPLGSEKAELDREIGQEVHHLPAVPEWKHGLGVEPGLAANQVVVYHPAEESSLCVH